MSVRNQPIGFGRDVSGLLPVAWQLSFGHTCKVDPFFSLPAFSLASGRPLFHALFAFFVAICSSRPLYAISFIYLARRWRDCRLYLRAADFLN